MVRAWESEQVGFGTLVDLHVEDILLTKYWETPTKISSVVMFSTQLGN